MEQVTTQALDERSFSVRGEHQRRELGSYTLRQMVEANEEDTNYVSWLVTAKVGDECATGGGAAPVIITRRTA